ncbi:MAG: hypothetical protein WBP45_07965, partial [Daejeonella sp.]
LSGCVTTSNVRVFSSLIMNQDLESMGVKIGELRVDLDWRLLTCDFERSIKEKCSRKDHLYSFI